MGISCYVYISSKRVAGASLEFNRCVSIVGCGYIYSYSFTTTIYYSRLDLKNMPHLGSGMDINHP